MGQVFKNGSSKICGRQPLKNLKFLKFFKGCVSQILLGPLLNTLSQMRIIFSLFTNELSSRLSACLWENKGSRPPLLTSTYGRTLPPPTVLREYSPSPAPFMQHPGSTKDFFLAVPNISTPRIFHNVQKV